MADDPLGREITLENALLPTTLNVLVLGEVGTLLFIVAVVKVASVLADALVVSTAPVPLSIK